MTRPSPDDEHEITLIPSWPAPARIRAYSTLRRGGVSRGEYASLNLGTHVGDDAASVAENRRRLVERLGLPAEPRWLQQVHGKAVLDLDRAAPGASSRLLGSAAPSLPAGPADAAVPARRGVVCVVLTADCVPVLLADRPGRRVGAAHAGWRGLAAGVLPAAVEALGAPAEDVVAWLGPAIGRAAFEVGDEVRAAFAEQGFSVGRAVERNARGRWQADLYALARESLNRAGVAAVYGGEHCTSTESDRFCSHRRSAPCGRMASLIWID